MIVYSGLNYRREIFKWNFAKNNEDFVRITNNLRAIGGTTNTKKATFVADITRLMLLLRLWKWLLI